MASMFTKWILLIILYVFTKPEVLIQAQQQVPCLFLFGDSQFDNGNNNALITTAKVNYPPYGIDYPAGPTGRFSNGKNIPDFLAQLLGFANSIPPFATVSRGSNDVLRGVNYASGAAGILDDSGIQLGDRISLNRQLINHATTVARINLLLLINNGTRGNDYLNKCLYVVNMGTNDYLNNYLLPQYYTTSRFFTPDTFAAFLIQKISQQLKQLYFSGARKVAVFGIGLLGCLPQELAMFPSNASGCVDFINDYVQLFNNRLRPLVDTFNTNLPGAQFTYINITSISSGDPSTIGLKVVNAPCCAVQRTTGQCVPNQVPCSNRSEYVFWDNFHPTEILNRVTASRAYTAFLPSDAYPLDIQSLVQQ